jgi:hypothetical protein
MQSALNQRIGVSLPPPTDEEKAKWILNYTRAMQQEMAELVDSVPWKWWAKSSICSTFWSRWPKPSA